MKNTDEIEGRRVPVPISLSASQIRHLDQRIKDLRPWLKGRSHIVQLLVDYDRKFDLFKKMKDQNPFDSGVSARLAA